MRNTLKWCIFYCCTICTVLVLINWSSRAVSVLSENAKPAREYCIVIDPGHGGEDGGAVSRSGLPESKYNLEISIRLRDMMHLLGYHTKMIRTSDVSVYTKGETLSQKKASDLKERVRMVNETDGAILLSIHQNCFPDERYNGAQVFYAQTRGSEELAKQIQSVFVSSLKDGNQRQVKKSSGIYLMEHIQCPGVLIECGFLSNATEDSKLKDPEYQKKISGMIAVAVGTFLTSLDQSEIH